MKTYNNMRLKFLFGNRIAGAWGDEPEDGNSIVCIRAADIVTEKIKHKDHDLTRRSFSSDEVRNKSLINGDLIIEKSGGGDNQPVGRVVLFSLDEPALCSNFMEILRPKIDKIIPDYGAYLLYSVWASRAVIPSIKQTTGIQNLDIGEYLNLRVDVPSSATQRLIAAYLDRETAHIDALIAAKERLLALLAEKRQALITRAVTRGLDENVKMKNSGVAWLGEVPEGWVVMHLKRALSLIEYGISEAIGTEGEFAVLRMGDIKDGEIDYSKVGFIDSSEQLPLLKKFDLVFNRTNSLEQIGKVAIFREKEGMQVSFASYLVRLRCNDRVIPEYLNMLLNSSYAQAWGKSEAIPAIGQANLNPNRYAYLPISLPQKEEQEAIIAHIQTHTARIDAIRTATERSIALLKERRSALISAAVTGRVELKE